MANELVDLLSADEDKVEVITLVVKGVDFCVDIRSVREIRGWTTATPIPHAPECVMGVINLRGVVMPVIDLASRLGLGSTEATGRHVVVVAQCRDQLAGLLVDSVSDTFVAPRAHFQAPPAVCGQEGSGMVDAILPVDGRMISRLVLDHVVQDTRELAA